MCFILKVNSGYTDKYENHVSLYSYSGYVTTPSAYITDGKLGFHYTYLPAPVAPFHKKHSDNWIFSGALGFLPFVEGYLSVFVAPKINISKSIPDYGADKTRSMGVKIRAFPESGRIPAVAVGIYDPNLKKAGVNFSANTVSSIFVVASKRHTHGEISLGYGYKGASGKYVRLKGIFGGITISLHENISVLADYDSEFWCAGLNVRCLGIDLLAAGVHRHGQAYRVGYSWQLLD